MGRRLPCCMGMVDSRLVPSYQATYGKVVGTGGAYAIANIRGGGIWSKMASSSIKENRQKGYDDFAAIAED